MSSSGVSDVANRSSSEGVSSRPLLRVICGPTGAGKTALAHQLARQHALQIISADSRQIYREFDIGTAKPPVAERAGIDYRGLDVAVPSARWSAARWARDAEEWIAECGPQRALVVGGTGLYLKALTAPLHESPELDPAQRAELDAQLQPRSVEELRLLCAELDPPRAHLGRTQLLRSIETARLTGRPLSAWHAESARPARFQARWLVVDPGAHLPNQIAERVDAMLTAGWLDEVRALMTRVPADAAAWQGCGYRALRDVVEGRSSLAAARETILIETRQYAKRQRTWFRHQLAGSDVTIVDPRDPDVHDLVEHWWSGGTQS
jgi:tRNA dimethylallyltransferase